MIPSRKISCASNFRLTNHLFFYSLPPVWGVIPSCGRKNEWMSSHVNGTVWTGKQ